VIGDLLLTLLVAGGLAVLFAAVLAPFESLSWWAGWSPVKPDEGVLQLASTRTELEPASRPDPIVVYLSGIGSISGEEILAEEIPFLDQLEARIRPGVLIRDVFPYSVTNTGLTGSTRLASTIWQWFGRLRLRGEFILSSLINARNAFQVAVSADQRYGPIFNYGTAQAIAQELVKVGLARGSGQRIVLVGYSGGGQVSIGAAPYLRLLTGCEVDVVSLGGVLSSDPGIRSVGRLTHIVGSKDVIEPIGRVMFFGRWPIAGLSAWNLARESGVLTVVLMPGMGHNVPGGYLDPEPRTAWGESYFDCTVRIIAAAVRRDAVELVPHRPARVDPAPPGAC
jgi:hypothetical protein